MDGQKAPEVVSQASVADIQVENNNPGTYEDLHRKCRDLFPICFEGAKAMVMKPLSSHFQVSHTLSISQAASGYKFGATYVGTKQFGPNEAYPVLLGDTDINGNTSATLLHQFNKMRVKFQGQVQNSQLTASQLCAEYRPSYTTFGLTIANPNIVKNRGIFVLHFLRRLTKNFDIGAEYVHQWDPMIPGKQVSALSYSARYFTPIWAAATTISQNAFHATYYHKHTDTIQAGVELDMNFRMQEASATLAYQFDIPEVLTFRASFDTNWTVGAVMERRLSKQLPFTLAISGMLNHAKAQGKFGVGLILG